MLSFLLLGWLVASLACCTGRLPAMMPLAGRRAACFLFRLEQAIGEPSEGPQSSPETKRLCVGVARARAQG
jgi:hypothetical protein